MINKIELHHVKEKEFGGHSGSVISYIKTMTANQLLIYLIVLFISRAVIMDGLTPFGIALVAAYLLKYNSATVVGIISSIGIISIQSVNSFKYLIVVWLIIGIFRFTKNKVQFTTFKIALLSSLILITVKGTSIILNDYYLYDMVMSGFEGIIVFSLTYIFTYSISVFEKSSNRYFTNEEVICGVIMLALTVSGFGNLNIWNLSFKNIIGALLIMIFAYIKGSTMGTTVGVTIGLVTSMSTDNMPIIIAVYGFAGLLSGLFRELGRIGTAIGFILGNGIISFYINGFRDPVIQLKEIAVAILLLIILSKILQKTNNIIFTETENGLIIEESYRDRIKDITYKRLKEVSSMFEELSTTFMKVADRHRIIEQKDVSKFINNVANDVCKNCSMYPFCWGNEFYNTYHLMFDIMGIIETNGVITEEELPDSFRKKCIKPNLIIQRSNYLFDLYKLNYKWENKILESRTLVSEQILGVAKIINDLANNIYNDVIFKRDVEKAIIAEFSRNGIDVKEVTVMQSENDRFEIILDLKSCMGKDKCINDIIPMISNIVGFELTRDKLSCSLPNSKGKCRLKLVKANRFGAVTKAASIGESFNYISGDSYTFGERDNTYYVALSDGMGIGQRAKQESDIAITLLEKLIETGFDRELALKTINSILVLKSNEEMFATMDMTLIDLYRGKTQFIKLGSAPTFIKKKNRVDIVNSQTLPLGILKNVDFQVYEGQLDDGDLIIMMSDGVLDSNTDVEDKEKWITEIIEEINSFNPQNVANSIIDAAKKSSKGQLRDDMTVLVTKIWKRR